MSTATPEPSVESNGITDSSVPSVPTLNLERLQSLPIEQRDLYLLTFSADVANLTSALNEDQTILLQADLKTELLQLVTLTTPFPTKAIRQNLGRAFSDIFTKGDRKPLYETINALIALLIASGKDAKDTRTKHAAVHILGTVFGAAGDGAVSLSSLACSTVLRQLKAAQSHAGLRKSIYIALAQLFRTVATSADESVARDAWTSARKAVFNDKAAIVQAAAAKCLKTLVQATPYFDNTSDFESLRSALLKAFEIATPHSRHALASTLAAVFLKCYVEDNAAPHAKPKKSKKQTTKQPKKSLDEDEDEIVGPEPSAGKKAIVKLSFRLSEILSQLSGTYVKTSASNKSRAAIVSCYRYVLKGLAQGVVESQYDLISENLLVEILNHTTIWANRHRLLLTRRYVRILLEDVIGRQLLGEAGQRAAATTLLNSIIKNYPQVIKESPEPSKHTLVGALNALASLIRSMGAAANSFADLCREGLIQVLSHPSYTVQITTSYCLRCFALSCPQQILTSIDACLTNTKRELDQLGTPQQSPRRCVGFSNGLAALLSITPMRPLNGSVMVNSRVFNLATELLKKSGESELRVSGTQIQAAWILIGGLMALGPNFVKIHLSQLLLLWRNALRKLNPAPKSAQQNLLELSFLSHVRECALGSILSFLEFNSKLLTTDVSKRLMTMLQSTTAFSESLPAKKMSDDINQRLFPALQLQDLDLMVNRRVLQIYTKLVTLSPAGASEALLQSNLLTLPIGFFADPENYSPLSLSSSIANAAGSYESIWEVGDNSGFGITGLIRGFSTKPVLEESKPGPSHLSFNRQGAKYEIDQALSTPVLGAREHDSLSLYSRDDNSWSESPDPPSSEVVNSAIVLFAVALPLQPPKIQESILEQLATFLSSHHLQRDPGRKAALTANIALALLITLKVSLNETEASPGDLKGGAVERVMQEMLRKFVIDQDQYIRNLGCEAIARLCIKSGNNLTTNEIKYLVDLIKANREPNARAGCAVALGCIHSRVGGMAAGLHLKTIYGFLMTLASDPNPIVHFWALEGLSRVAESAGLTFSGYVPSTLGMLGQLYVSDDHNEEVAQSGNSNLELDCPTSFALGRCLDSLINVLGPDLQDMSKARDMIITLVQQFQKDASSLMFIESLRCLEHLSLYASSHIEITTYVRRLQRDFGSTHGGLRDIAIDGLYNLMKRNARQVVEESLPGLDDELWMALDQSPDHEGIRNAIWTWLEQTGLAETEHWLQRFQTVLTKTKPRPQATATTAQEKKGAGMPDLQDEEVAGFAAEAGVNKDDASSAPGAGQEPLKWQVRTFALECLNFLLRTVEKQVAVSDEPIHAEVVLQKKISDVVRIAFSAATGNVVELRVWGLRTIDRILKMFGKTPDPDFVEASLLEQYQAQISSALTPAFASDSSPELASAAVKVCASFIATGIVTDVERMGRILKLLVSALDNFSEKSDTASIGDLQGLSSNAQVMVRMAVFSAWAELQIASLEQQYLVEVVKPHIAKLTPLWLASLREFAKLRFEPDISMNIGPPSAQDSPDVMYSALNRETLLGFYQDNWLKLVDAIASLIEQDSDFVFEALDGKDAVAPINGVRKGHDINYRDEPVAFFFVLYGITFEALAVRSAGDEEDGEDQTLEILQALKKILHPSVSGQAIYQEVIFSETMDLFDRLVLTEEVEVQAVVVEIARDLCLSHPSARREQSETPDTLTEDIEQLFSLTRIINLVLTSLVPALSPTPPPFQTTKRPPTALIQSTLSALLTASATFPAVIRTDLHACILHIFLTLFSDPPAPLQTLLPLFKRFLTTLLPLSPRSTTPQLLSTLQTLLTTLHRSLHATSEADYPTAKTTLLATTLLLTTTSAILPASSSFPITHLSTLLASLVQPPLSAIASSCLRSILLTPSSETPAALNAWISHLLPRLIAITTATDSTTKPARGARRHAASLLAAFAAKPDLQSEQRQKVFEILVPALLVRASATEEEDDEEEEGDDRDPDLERHMVSRETAAWLLDLARLESSAFKSVVARLAARERATLETVLARGAAGSEQLGKGKEVAREDEEQDGPKIELKFDFGG
ncbi:MAG: hypothetical protein M1814_003551 [Vezdaea aestivalis]|nr:MAG: hypothetical protein M1814_003551 [Vezdaea aestivalis]